MAPAGHQKKTLWLDYPAASNAAAAASEAGDYAQAAIIMLGQPHLLNPGPSQPLSDAYQAAEFTLELILAQKPKTVTARQFQQLRAFLENYDNTSDRAFTPLRTQAGNWMGLYLKVRLMRQWTKGNLAAIPAALRRLVRFARSPHLAPATANESWTFIFERLDKLADHDGLAALDFGRDLLNGDDGPERLAQTWDFMFTRMAQLAAVAPQLALGYGYDLLQNDVARDANAARAWPFVFATLEQCAAADMEGTFKQIEDMLPFVAAAKKLPALLATLSAIMYNAKSPDEIYAIGYHTRFERLVDRLADVECRMSDGYRAFIAYPDHLRESARRGARNTVVDLSARLRALRMGSDDPA